MNKEQLYDEFLNLPLFQGLSRTELAEIDERIAIRPIKQPKRFRLTGQDEQADGLVFILKGQVRSKHQNSDGTYFLEEWHSAPFLIQPEALFGMRTLFSHTYTAETEIKVFKIWKEDVRFLLSHYPTFRINYLNLICYTAQRNFTHLWHNRRHTLEEQIVSFFLQRILRPAGKKELHIKMDRLAQELGATRLRTSQALHNLAKKGNIELKRETIMINSFQDLLK